MHYQARQRIDAVRAGNTDTLNLSHLDLTELPEEVFTLRHLRVLRVRNIRLAINQPMIDLMKKIRTVSFDPDFIAMLEEEERELQQDLLVPKQLQALDDRISQLTALDTLDLGYNQLTHLPDSLGRLPNLRLLRLNDNQLTTVPTSLGQLSRLELLDLHDNPLTEKPVFPHLDKFAVYGTHFKPQKDLALREKDYELAAWFRQKELSYGLIL